MTFQPDNHIFNEIGLTHNFDSSVQESNTNSNLKTQNNASLLSLICPSSISGKTRRRASKSVELSKAKCDEQCTLGEQKNNVANNGNVQNNSNVNSNSNGCEVDNSTLTRWVQKANGPNVEVLKSVQSFCGAQLTISDASARITKWLSENASLFVFYFSGNGNEKGIALKNGILSYSRLLSLLLCRPATTSMIIAIDTCNSGAILDALHDTLAHRAHQNTRGTIYFSSQKNENSADQASNGGYFTSTYFQQDIAYLLNLADCRFPAIRHVFPDGSTAVQTPGSCIFSGKKRETPTLSRATTYGIGAAFGVALAGPVGVAGGLVYGAIGYGVSKWGFMLIICNQSKHCLYYGDCYDDSGDWKLKLDVPAFRTKYYSWIGKHFSNAAAYNVDRNKLVLSASAPYWGHDKINCGFSNVKTVWHEMNDGRTKNMTSSYGLKVKAE